MLGFISKPYLKRQGVSSALGSRQGMQGSATSAGVSMQHCETGQPLLAAVWTSLHRITCDPPRSAAQMCCVALLHPGKLLASQARKSRQSQWSKTKGQRGLRKQEYFARSLISNHMRFKQPYIKFCPQVRRNATDRRGINTADFRNGTASC